MQTEILHSKSLGSVAAVKTDSERQTTVRQKR